jgi:hypothetical protein
MEDGPTRCDYCGSAPSTRRLDDVVSMTVHRSVFDPRRSAIVHRFFCDEDHLRQWMVENPALPFDEERSELLVDEGDADLFDEWGDPVGWSPRTRALAYGSLVLQVLVAGFAIFGVVATIMLLT